jgi:hypothetical protein
MDSPHMAPLLAACELARVLGCPPHTHTHSLPTAAAAAACRAGAGLAQAAYTGRHHALAAHHLHPPGRHVRPGFTLSSRRLCPPGLGARAGADYSLWNWRCLLWAALHPLARGAPGCCSLRRDRWVSNQISAQAPVLLACQAWARQARAWWRPAADGPGPASHPGAPSKGKRGVGT